MWSNKEKNQPNSPSYLAKISTKIEKGRILTPDGNQILVGIGQNLILIWKAEADFWNNLVQKITNGSWSTKTKTPIT